MKPVRFGRTGLHVSPLCLGTMTFGWQADEEESHAILNTALEAGVSFIDTADAYPIGAEGKRAGLTEEIIGRWLVDHRDEVILATKFYSPVGPPHGTARRDPRGAKPGADSTSPPRACAIRIGIGPTTNSKSSSRSRRSQTTSASRQPPWRSRGSWPILESRLRSLAQAEANNWPRRSLALTSSSSPR